MYKNLVLSIERKKQGQNLSLVTLKLVFPENHVLLGKYWEIEMTFKLERIWHLYPGDNLPFSYLLQFKIPQVHLSV